MLKTAHFKKGEYAYDNAAFIAVFVSQTKGSDESRDSVLLENQKRLE
jgi:hypothetical protein